MTGAHTRSRPATWVAVALVCVLLAARDARALNPALDVSQYAHKAWLIRDGSFKGQIRSITQGADGYLWLGTEFGVLRFDGVTAVPWEPPGDQHLPSSDIWSVLAGRDGSLWIGTAKGLARWKGGRITQYPEMSGHYIVTLFEDREGTVWASATAVPAGLLCAVRNSAATCSGSFVYGPRGVYEDRKGFLWVGASGGVWRWQPQPRAFFTIPATQLSTGVIEESADGILLVGTQSGLRRVRGDTTEPYSISKSREPYAQCLKRDRDGGLWIGTATNGLAHVYQGKTDQFGPGDGLSGQSVNRIFEDREGNVWVATDGGLDRFREMAVSTMSVRQGLPSHVMNVKGARDGSVWMVSPGGIARWINRHLIAYRGALPAGLYPAIYEDDRGRTWVTSRTAFGYLRENTFVEMRAVPARMVRAIAEDQQGDIWVADQQLGLFRVSSGGTVDRLPWSAVGHADFATAIAAERGRAGLWVGFFNGGVAYVEDNKVRASYGSASGLAGGWVRGFQSEQDGSLWVAAEGGLSRLYDGHAATLDHTNGLPCDTADWVIADDAGSLWVNMACGLVRITRQDIVAWVSGRTHSVTPTVLDAADGVRSEWLPRGYTKAADGKIWFVGPDGLNVIDPRHLQANPLPPPVHVEGIIADHKTYDATTPVNGQIHLPALTRDIQIDYAALSLVAPEKNRFRYKLEGKDRDWHDVGTRREAYYSDLKPRTYRFHVSASNNSGMWNDTGAVLDFSVDPTYYQTTWFLVAVVGTALLLIAGLYRLRVRQVTHRYNLQIEARVNERTRVARDLHDTLLQSFHAVVLRLRAATYLLADGPENARKTLDSVIDEASKAIVDARDAVQGLRTSSDPTTTLVDAIAALANELETEDASPSRPQFILHVEGTPGGLQPLVRDDVFRIAREALCNAFRHANATQIETDVRYDRRQFRLRIRDNGTGIDDAVLERGRSGHFGLGGMRERADLVKGALTIWTEPNGGTEIELTIPASIAYRQ